MSVENNSVVKMHYIDIRMFNKVSRKKYLAMDSVLQNSQKRITFRGSRKPFILKMGPEGISAANVLIVSVILKCYDHTLI